MEKVPGKKDNGISLSRKKGVAISAGETLTLHLNMSEIVL